MIVSAGDYTLSVYGKQENVAEARSRKGTEQMKNWSDVLLDPSTSIGHAIEVIDKSSLQIALVVDGQKQLIGTVTDGDIRRAIIKGVSLQESVSTIMNGSPITAHQAENRKTILDRMKARRIHHIPILDEQNRVVHIEVLEDMILSPSQDHWVVLMAGGLGTRLRPLTEQCPKPLLKVGEKPILQLILENFIEQGFKRFFIAVNYKADMIEAFFRDGSEWGAEIHYIREDQRLGTAGALSLLPERPAKPFFVVNGDVLTKMNARLLLDFHIERQSKATMCIKELQYQIPYGVVEVDQYDLKNIVEKPDHRFFVSAGIYVLEPDVLSEVPKDQFFDMPNLFIHLLEQKQEVTVFPIREYWLDIGRMDDFEKAKLDYKEVFK